jgi:hypothetical protein
VRGDELTTLQAAYTDAACRAEALKDALLDSTDAGQRARLQDEWSEMAEQREAIATLGWLRDVALMATIWIAR